jgi:hypothetical protein
MSQINIENNIRIQRKIHLLRETRANLETQNSKGATINVQTQTNFYDEFMLFTN